MASGINQLTQDFAYVQIVAGAVKTDRCQAIYNQHCDRIFSLAFYMSGSEPAAEAFVERTFTRAFAASNTPSGDMIDRALISELKDEMTIGETTLKCEIKAEMLVARRNVKRTTLEQAVLNLPATEKLVYLMHDVESYAHARIARLLGITEDESRTAVHQARLRIRELLAAAN